MKLLSFILLAVTLGAVVPCMADAPKGPTPGAALGARAFAPHRGKSARSWAQDVLRRESDYIVDCSFTESARNRASVQMAADGYGAINVVRIFQKGPDWVRPGEAAMGAIGMMAAAIRLKAAGFDIARYNGVLSRFFRTWLLARKQPMESNASSADYGGFFERVYYDDRGKWVKHDEVNAGVTGQMLAAMWKFYEYNRAMGRPRAAHEWLQQSWPIARRAGDFLKKNYNPRYRLVRANSTRPDLWISDGTYAAMGLRCLDRWAEKAGMRRRFDYAALAASIVIGLQHMKDASARRSFFRFRDSRRQFRPTYGDRIDQLCFLPYEADVIDPGEPFAHSISNWWTNGSEGISLTFRTSDSSDWRNFGTRYRYSPASAPENKNLYPGPGLQLAKVEWKYARRTGDRVTLGRARKRFEWARGAAYSNLWLGSSGAIEANVPNGLVDWRDSTQYAHTAGDWARFVDTSAYFIEVALMLEYGVDTRYVPAWRRSH